MLDRLKLVPNAYELPRRQVTVVLIALSGDPYEKILLLAQCAPLVSTDRQGAIHCISSFLPLSRKARSPEGLDRVFIAVRPRIAAPFELIVDACPYSPGNSLDLVCKGRRRWRRSRERGELNHFGLQRGNHQDEHRLDLLRVNIVPNSCQLSAQKQPFLLKPLLRIGCGSEHR
ncbi:MAG TPA: hypothetical protein VK474_11145 [Chthoniobacterales bacterium]|nr:hypothetical protein [Chthoniobacterales bacterium]